MTEIASEGQKKTKYAVSKSSIDEINAYAAQHGLENPVLKRLLNSVVSSKSLDQASQNALIESLYPAVEVSDDVVYLVTGSLGHGSLKPSLPTQQGLIKWLVKVYDLIEDPAVLSNLYSVLFNLLDTLSLRADLCCLLSLITRKKHVKPFRLQMLQRLSRIAGHEPALSKLISVYDEFAPGRLDSDRLKKGANIFSYPDLEWGGRLEQIQSRKRSHSINGGHQDEQSSLPLREKLFRIDNFTSQRLDSTNEPIDDLSKPLPPGLTISDLQKPRLMNRAVLKSKEGTMAAIDELLSPSLDQQLEKMQHGQQEDRVISDILDKALTLTKYIKVQ